MKRPSIPKETEATLLAKCRRRCALCFYLNRKLTVRQGQIAHVDRNPRNNAEANLAYLCLTHHDDYDSTRSQSKGFHPGELRKAKEELERLIQNDPFVLASDSPTSVKLSKNTPRVTAEIYSLRLPIYLALLRFLIHVNREAHISDEEIGRFIEETHTALFLFGKEIESYVREIYERAITMRQAQRRMEHPERCDNAQWERIVEAEGAGMLWFSEQQRNVKNKFYPYLRI